MENILYHYTDFRAMEGIVTNATLRVNNVLNMNDASEMSFFMQTTREKISKRLDPRLVRIIAEHVEEIYEYYQERLFAHSAYAACFSLFPDDAAQWERYGHHGRGVCIGFRQDLLMQMLTPGMSLTRVYYDSEEKSDEIANRYCDMANSNVQEILAGHISKEIDKLADEIMREAWISSAAYKHPSFVCENEVRLVFWPELTEMKDIAPGYHVTSERIKKYYPLNLRTLCENAGIAFENLFTEIKIGPESTQSPLILADYFRDQGMPVLAENIRLSDCPLRITMQG